MSENNECAGVLPPNHMVKSGIQMRIRTCRNFRFTREPRLCLKQICNSARPGEGLGLERPLEQQQGVPTILVSSARGIGGGLDSCR